MRAAVDEDPRAIRQAVMVDPATAGALPVERIWEMYDELVVAHGKYLASSLRAACT